MMYKSIILPRAKQDIKEAAQYYNSQQKGLGKRFTKQVREKIQLLQQKPKIAAIRYNNTRTATLEKFPFMVHYAIDEKRKALVIITVFHTSRDAEKWKK